MPRPYFDPTSLRSEIAACAARLIAEEGLDYVSAKRKAVKQLAPDMRLQRDLLPDNDEIADELRIHQQLFQADTQPARLVQLRRVALALMRILAPYDPHLTGAVLNGTAGEHSDIHLHLFADNVKEVEMFLLNQGIDFDAHEAPPDNRHMAGRGKIETLSFMWSPAARQAAEGAHLSLFDRDSLRKPGVERANLRAVEQLVSSVDEDEQ